MAKILIVEDEPNMRMGLNDNLSFEGYEVDLAEEGRKGLDMILKGNYDLVVLDVMMPNLSGFDICREIRSRNMDVPVIMLTAKGEEIDKVLGLELGADDYITKPFSIREFLARIKAILRRTEDKDAPVKTSSVITIGKLTVNFSSYNAEMEGAPVKMSHKEFEILKFLIERKNQTVSRYDLLENIWGYDGDITTRTVDNFISRLRQKVEDNPNNPAIILTAHGIGYKLIG